MLDARYASATPKAATLPVFAIAASVCIDGASGRDLDDARLTVRRTEDELRDGDREREAPWTRAARVDEENASALLHPRAVRVTGQDRRKPGVGGLGSELGEAVDAVGGVRPFPEDAVDRHWDDAATRRGV